jgi:acyl-coenzyme A synthetase/AMP-(fatty) acid ligase
MLVNIHRNPADSLAVVDSQGNKLTYGEIVEFSTWVSENLPKRSLVFHLSVNNGGSVAWAMGFINSSVVPLLLNSKIDDSLFNNLFTTYQPNFICIPGEYSKKFNFKIVAEKFGYCLLETGFNPTPLHEDLSHLLPTSGSTGSPKLVRHSYQNIEAAGLNISTFFNIDQTHRALMVLPLYYTMGLSMVFSHFYAGATILITDLSMTDKLFWDFLKNERATSFTGVPYSFEILNLMRFFRMDLPDLKILTQGGGKMQKDLNLKFAEYCRDKGKEWIATYGQTEGTARMAYLPSEYAISKIGSIGRAVPNGELSLIDIDGNPITKPFTEGEMCYRGKNVTMGYALCKDDLLQGDERGGFIKTGDLAYFDEDGCYYIVGRLQRFIKLFGMRVGLDECEQIVKAHYPIDCVCVGTDEKMSVYITDESYSQKVKEILVEKTRIIASSFSVKFIDKIPKNDAGKVLYSNLSN